MKAEAIQKIFKSSRQFDQSAGAVKVNPGVSLTLYALRGRLIVTRVTRLSIDDGTVAVTTDRGESYFFDADSLAAVKIEETTSTKASTRPGFSADT